MKIELIKKRNGQVVDFDPEKIHRAIRAAFNATYGSFDVGIIDQIADNVVSDLEQRAAALGEGYLPQVEEVQDIVEKEIMEAEFFDVAKAYIVYRYEHAKIREKSEAEKGAEIQEKLADNKLSVIKRSGKREKFSREKLVKTIREVAVGLDGEIDVEGLVSQCERELYDGISTAAIAEALVLVARSWIEKDPVYSDLAARLLHRKNYREVIGTGDVAANDFITKYQKAFISSIKAGVKIGKLDRRLLDFDLAKLGKQIVVERDNLLKYLGAQTLYDRYYIQNPETKARLETPQMMWMRVAMGLAVNEKNRDKWAIKFYEMMSTLRYIPSTPTLFHAGTVHPQLSSCYLNTVQDDLSHIFKVIGDNAQLSKWSGGIGTDWTNLRATGALIKGTGVESQGVIPFLKVANDATHAINRSGRRRGAACVYLETWHLDIEDFLELRKNTGDDRRRTHDIDTANWIPDLFMKRVRDNEEWTLFSPEEVPDLHELYGKAFENRYHEYESLADLGKIKLFKKVKAKDLWKKMLAMLFETGHPWITWKDPANVRSPQDHVGVIHNSNLCTEITLNTSAEETAVCNLGSINLGRHLIKNPKSKFLNPKEILNNNDRNILFPLPEGEDKGEVSNRTIGQPNNGFQLDEEKLAETVSIAMRMLDNVVDINFYPTIEARESNMKHRPVGLGIMGFQDALYQLGINFDSEEMVAFADTSMELIAYHAYLASSELAKERGAYKSYRGSKWDRGILPQDTLDLLEKERSEKVSVDRSERLDWQRVRESINKHGMRNSNCLAMAPTATISNIAGSIPTIEPIYKNIYVKSNASGDFVVVNSYLIEELKSLGLWNDLMLAKLKYFDGNIRQIVEIPYRLREKYKETFEIDSRWLIKAAAHRGKWVDQSQSLNIYFSGTSGAELSQLYFYAWELGLKTTYYLRTLAKSQVEKSTVNTSAFGVTHTRHQGAEAINPKEIQSPHDQKGENLAPVASLRKGNEKSSQSREKGNVETVGHLDDMVKTPAEIKLCRIDDPHCESCQ